MYTAESATSRHIRYAYDPEHPDADAEGFVTYATLAWDDQSFIATAMPGTMLPSEAYALAACEMNSVERSGAKLDRLLDRIILDA
jgi:hypothetical protein